jgi:hypothetical protein
VLWSAGSSSAPALPLSATRGRISSTLSAKVPRRVDDAERADDDVADAQARRPETAFHSAEPARAVHFPDRRASADADVAFRDRTCGRARACLVRGVSVRPDVRIADGEIVDHRGDDDRDAEIRSAPVEADLALFEESQDAAGSRQGEDAASGQEEPVDAIDRTGGLEQNGLGFSGGRPVVVHSGSGGRVEEDRRAARGPPRVREVADLDAWDVGQGAGGHSLLAAALQRDSRSACHRSSEFTARVDSQ